MESAVSRLHWCTVSNSASGQEGNNPWRGLEESTGGRCMQLERAISFHDFYLTEISGCSVTDLNSFGCGVGVTFWLSNIRLHKPLMISSRICGLERDITKNLDMQNTYLQYIPKILMKTNETWWEFFPYSTKIIVFFLKNSIEIAEDKHLMLTNEQQMHFVFSLINWELTPVRLARGCLEASQSCSCWGCNVTPTNLVLACFLINMWLTSMVRRQNCAAQ